MIKAKIDIVVEARIEFIKEAKDKLNFLEWMDENISQPNHRSNKDIVSEYLDYKKGLE